MKWYMAAFIGLLIHTLGMSAFIAASSHHLFHLWKLAAIASTMMLMAALLCLTVWQLKTWRSLLLLTSLLALGYAVAYHIAGFLLFPGLLSDMDYSTQYFFTWGHIIAFIFLMYTTFATLIFLLLKVIKRRRPART